MEDGRILDSQITASSALDNANYDHAAHYARLNLEGIDTAPNAWVPGGKDLDEWIQVDLGASGLVSGIVMQGRDDPNQQNWVTKYKVQFSQDGGKTWRYVKGLNLKDVQVKSLTILIYCVLFWL